MPRSGLYKSDVKKARNALLAQGKHPSLDAVRIELGNTGSKTTIHKYLKELEEDEGSGTGKKASVSEALQDLVERLAAQLNDEANARIDDVQTQAAENERRHIEALAAAQQANDTLAAQLQATERRLQEENDAHAATRERMQRESISRHTAEQQVTDLKERLLENENHRRSLEDKHQHARQALEHYRESVKEQRDQDQRRHEQQVQQLQAEMRVLQQNLIVRQEEVTRLNQEGARLVGELSHSQRALRDRESQISQMAQKLESLQVLEERCRILAAQIAEKDAVIEELKVQRRSGDKEIGRLQVELSAANARLESQQAITTELRQYLEKLQPSQMGAGGNDGA